MDHYKVLLYKQAVQDLDDIYTYIADHMMAPRTAMSLINELEKTIYSLEELPHRGAERRIGAFADQGYRQLIANGYLILYRILEDKKQVHIVTVRHHMQEF